MEEWKDCILWPNYQVSDLGNVLNKTTGQILKLYPQKNGYVYAILDRGHGRTYVPVHVLVAIAFHGIEGRMKGLYVDHINTIRSDNRAVNLHYVTPKQNSNNPITKLNRRKKHD